MCPQKRREANRAMEYDSSFSSGIVVQESSLELGIGKDGCTDVRQSCGDFRDRFQGIGKASLALRCGHVVVRALSRTAPALRHVVAASLRYL